MGLPLIEMHIMLSFFGFLVFYLQFATLKSLVSRFSLIFFGMVLFKSHELMAGLGFVLAFVSFLRAKKEASLVAVTLRCFIVASLFSALVSFYYILVPTHVGSRSDFFHSLMSLDFLFLGRWQVNHLALLSILSVLILFVGMFVSRFSRGEVLMRILSFVVFCTGLWTLWVFAMDLQFWGYAKPYLSRVWCAVSIVLVLLFIYIETN